MKAKYKVEEKFLNHLLKNNARLVLLNDTLQKTPELHPPTFKADKSLGEGKPYPGELEYRQALLDLLKEAYNNLKTIVTGPGSIDDKRRKMDVALNNAIKQADSTITDNVTQCYKAGLVEANNKLTQTLKAKGKHPDNLVDIEAELKGPTLANLIAYQQYNFEKWITQLKYDLLDALWSKKVLTFYGNK